MNANDDNWSFYDILYTIDDLKLQTRMIGMSANDQFFVYNI